MGEQREITVRGDDDASGSAIGLAAVLTTMLVGVTALLLAMAPAGPGGGTDVMRAGPGAGCAGPPSSQVLFGLVCGDG